MEDRRGGSRASPRRRPRRVTAPPRMLGSGGPAGGQQEALAQGPAAAPCGPHEPAEGGGSRLVLEGGDEHTSKCGRHVSPRSRSQGCSPGRAARRSSGRARRGARRPHCGAVGVEARDPLGDRGEGPGHRSAPAPRSEPTGGEDPPALVGVDHRAARREGCGRSASGMTRAVGCGFVRAPTYWYTAMPTTWASGSSQFGTPGRPRRRPTGPRRRRRRGPGPRSGWWGARGTPRVEPVGGDGSTSSSSGRPARDARRGGPLPGSRSKQPPPVMLGTPGACWAGEGVVVEQVTTGPAYCRPG